MQEPPAHPTHKSVTYASYLRIDDLLKLQSPLSDPVEHDEMLFIVIHQVYELWFRQLLHEFDKLGLDFRENRMHAAMSTLKRVRTIMKTLVGQLDILETMTPMEFNSFRNRLESASGFQSAQFREFEFLLGYKRTPMMKHHDPKSGGFAALDRRLKAPSIVDHFYAFIEHQGFKLPPEVMNRDLTEPTRSQPAVQEAALQIYKTRPDASVLLELMVDFDEGLQEWRYRHVKMVERTIGVKMGTGGSSGVDFLKKTLFMPVFPDLWEIRHRL